MTKRKYQTTALTTRPTLDLTTELVTAEMLTRAGWRSSNALPTITNPSAAWRIMRSEHGATAISNYYDDFEEKHSHYGGQLETRREALLATKRNIVAVSDNPEDQKIRDATAEMIAQIKGFDTILEESLDCLGKGVAIGEILWAYQSGLLMPTTIKWRPQYLFAFGRYSEAQTGELRLCPDGFGDGMPVSQLNAPEKLRFIVVTFKGKKGNRWGAPLARKCFWPIWFELQGARTWLKYLEKGTGTVVVKYKPTNDSKLKDQALESAQTINEDVACAIADGMSVDILEKARSGSTEIYQTWVENYCHGLISRRILGQTLTSQGGEGGYGSRALGEVHKTIQDDKKKTDAKLTQDWINDQLIASFILLNFGPNIATPRVEFDVEEQEDLKSRSEVDERLQKMGLPIGMDYVRKTYNVPEPRAGEEILTKQMPEPFGPPAPDGNEPPSRFAREDNPTRTRKNVDRMEQIIGGAETEGVNAFEDLIQKLIADLDK